MSLKLILYMELLWWLITGVVIVAVLYPIWHAGLYWPFQTWNMVTIAAVITFTRHIFLLKYTLIARRQILKAAIIIAMVPITFACISYLNEFMVFVEEKTWEPITGHLPLKQKTSIEAYMWNELLFFSVGTLVCIPLLGARLFMSIWKQYNNRLDEI